MDILNKRNKYPVFNLDIPRMGYFILYRMIEKDFIHRQIEKVQLEEGFDKVTAKFIHCETSGGGPNSVAAIPPKTQVIDITEKHKGAYIRIVKYKECAADSKKSAKIAFWASSLSNLRYDWFGVIAFKFPWLVKPFSYFRKKWYFCSEGNLWALQKEYFGALEIKPEECLPAHFCNSHFFETIWEGYLPA